MSLCLAWGKERVQPCSSTTTHRVSTLTHTHTPPPLYLLHQCYRPHTHTFKEVASIANDLDIKLPAEFEDCLKERWPIVVIHTLPLASTLVYAQNTKQETKCHGNMAASKTSPLWAKCICTNKQKMMEEWNRLLSEVRSNAGFSSDCLAMNCSQ